MSDLVERFLVFQDSSLFDRRVYTFKELQQNFNMSEVEFSYNLSEPVSKTFKALAVFVSDDYLSGGDLADIKDRNA